jgi:hypothetical protein
MPKPWRIARSAWWETGNMEMILEKRDKAIMPDQPKGVPVSEGGK